MAISQANKNALKNPWALGLMAIFALFLLANTVFIYLAFQSAPNMVVSNYYQRGEQVQQLQQAMENQKALEWQVSLQTPAKIRVEQPQLFEFFVQDKTLSAIELESVVLHAYRPSDSAADFNKTMTRIAPGHYQTEALFGLVGSWDIIIEAQNGKDEFLLTKRIDIAP